MGEFRHARDKSLPSLFLCSAILVHSIIALFSFSFLCWSEYFSSLSSFSSSFLSLGLGVATCSVLALMCSRGVLSMME